MRILLLTQVVPFPPIAGPKIKTWHVLRYLAAHGHEILLASFARLDEEQYLAELTQVCCQVHTAYIYRSRLVDGLSWLRSYITGRPFLVERDDLFAMHSLVDLILKTEHIDAIHADQLSMAQFALPAPARGNWFSRKSNSENALRSDSAASIFRVFDAHNATWSIVERMISTLPGNRALLKPLLRAEARRVKCYEGMVVQAFDHTLAVTDVDQRALLEARQTYLADVRDTQKKSKEAKITVIPIAVDTEQRLPIQRQPHSYNIFTLGTLYYPPNADGIRWFIHEVFPRVRQQVPAATLTIVGKNPPQDFTQMAERNPQSIQVTGYVPDLAPYLQQAALAVVPVRAGSGMRVRILEMFAHAMPVVTTTVGLEGIEAQHGKEVLVADTPEEFAAAVVRLLQDPGLQGELAANGRRLAEIKYDWKVALSKLTEIYAEK